jgi:hypothetical protein
VDGLDFFQESKKIQDRRFHILNIY